MARADAERWDSRYAGRTAAAPSAPDAVAGHGVLDLIPSTGRALDIACGAGAQAAWLAERGLDVEAIDASGIAVDLTRATAAAAGVADRVHAAVVDLDAGIPADLGDFDVIVCQRYRQPDLYDAFVGRLRPGGVAVVTVLSAVGADEPGPFHAPAGELARAFSRPDVDVAFSAEADGQASVVVSRLVDPLEEHLAQ